MSQAQSEHRANIVLAEPKSWFVSTSAALAGVAIGIVRVMRGDWSSRFHITEVPEVPNVLFYDVEPPLSTNEANELVETLGKLGQAQVIVLEAHTKPKDFPAITSGQSIPLQAGVDLNQLGASGEPPLDPHKGW